MATDVLVDTSGFYALLVKQDDQHDAVLSFASAICQICGDDITSDVVFCRSCKTPHHEDCWQYYGACSTYGCGQTRFLVSKKRNRSKIQPGDRAE